MTEPQDGFFGGGAPSLSFADDRSMGYWRGGTIVHIGEEEQARKYGTNVPDFWPKSGEPIMQLPVTLATEERDPGNPKDNGHRRIFIKGYLKSAIANAFREAGVPGIRLGGKLMICWTHGGEIGNPDKTKFWAAKYEPPQPGQQTDSYFATAERNEFSTKRTQQGNGGVNPGAQPPINAQQYAPSTPAMSQPVMAAPGNIQYQPQQPAQAPQTQPQWQPQPTQQPVPAATQAVQQAARYVATADAGQLPIGPPQSHMPWMNASPPNGGQPSVQQPQAAPQWQPQQQGQVQMTPQFQQTAAEYGVGPQAQAPQQNYQPVMAPQGAPAPQGQPGQQPVYQPPPFDPANPFGGQPQAQQPPQGQYPPGQEPPF